MLDINFDDQVVIITGAGGGLGRAYALEIGRRGGAVVVNDLGANVNDANGSSAMADRVVAEIREAGGRAVASYESVATLAGAQAIVQKALDEFGRVDALINNAGNLRTAWFEDFRDEDRDALLQVHLVGTYNMSRMVWPHMKKQAYGRIVFTSSGAGMFGMPTQAGYGAAKGGIIGLMNVLSVEGREHGILCNGLLPNAETRMSENTDMEVNRKLGEYAMTFAHTLQRSYIAPVTVFLASRACKVTHQFYSVAGGRIGRVFIGVTEGWVQPDDSPASVEDVSAHIDEIDALERGVFVPESLEDEFRLVIEQRRRLGARSIAVGPA